MRVPRAVLSLSVAELLSDPQPTSTVHAIAIPNDQTRAAVPSMIPSLLRVARCAGTTTLHRCCGGAILTRVATGWRMKRTRGAASSSDKKEI